MLDCPAILNGNTAAATFVAAPALTELVPDR